MHEQGKETYWDFTARFQCPGEDVQVTQDRGHGVPAEREELLGRGLVVAHVGGVVLERRLADTDEMLKEALAGVGKGGVREGVEGATEPELVARHDEELSDADEALAELALDHLGLFDVDAGGLAGFLVVDVLCDDG